MILAGAERWKVITEVAVEVGPAFHASLLIITLSFIPYRSSRSEGQEGRLFGPPARTKTWSMAASAFLAVVSCRC